MIAIVRHRGGRIVIAERSYLNGSLTIWKASDGHIWLKSWVQVIQELDMTMDEARLVYPEYFV